MMQGMNRVSAPAQDKPLWGADVLQSVVQAAHVMSRSEG